MDWVAFVLGEEETREREEEERSLSRLGQPGGEPPPGGRTGTRHPIKQCCTALHEQLSMHIKLALASY